MSQQDTLFTEKTTVPQAANDTGLAVDISRANGLNEASQPTEAGSLPKLEGEDVSNMTKPSTSEASPLTSINASSDILLAKKLMASGVDFISSTLVSYGVAWAIGAQFTLSSFWRIIIGTGLAFATHAVRIYRMIRL